MGGVFEYPVEFNTSHYKKDVTIEIKSDLKEPTVKYADPGSWGIRDFFIFFTRCHFLCKWCNGETEKHCTNCEPMFVLRNNECVCKPRHYRVIPTGCEDMNCTSCIPCNPSCGECNGPTTVDCKNCLSN